MAAGPQHESNYDRAAAPGDVVVTASADRIRAALAEARGRVFEAVRGLNEEQFRHVPPGEQWPIAAHLAHLLRLEREHAAAVRKALSGGDAVMPHIPDENAGDPDLAARMAIPQIVHGLLNARRELDMLLDAADDAALAHEVRHEKMPPTPVSTLLVMLSQHDEAHATEIARLARLAPASARVTLPLRQRS